jgi:Leucine-rich repeat (LRR) protein
MPLVQLNMLGLDFNQLVDFSDVNIFKGIEQIQQVLLGYNNIVAINANLFEGLSNLEVVDMSENPICLKQPDYVRGLCSADLNCQVTC